MHLPTTMSQTNTKALNFLITACCVCRRIRSDDGAWGEGHDLLSIAEPRGLVTHSICEECLPKQYPELSNHILSKYTVAS